MHVTLFPLRSSTVGSDRSVKLELQPQLEPMSGVGVTAMLAIRMLIIPAGYRAHGCLVCECASTTERRGGVAPAAHVRPAVCQSWQAQERAWPGPLARPARVGGGNSADDMRHEGKTRIGHLGG